MAAIHVWYGLRTVFLASVFSDHLRIQVKGKYVLKALCGSVLRIAYCVLSHPRGRDLEAQTVLRIAYCVMSHPRGRDLEAQTVLRIAYSVLTHPRGPNLEAQTVLRITYCVLRP